MLFPSQRSMRENLAILFVLARTKTPLWVREYLNYKKPWVISTVASYPVKEGKDQMY